MTIREVIYYEAWCDASTPHRLDLGDYSGYGQREGVESDLAAMDETVRMPDGRIYCHEHIPDDVCTINRPPYGNGLHEPEPTDAPDERHCVHCDVDLPVATPQAVTA